MNENTVKGSSLLPAVDGWPAGQVPFPVSAPFRMRPGLQRLTGSLAAALAPDAGKQISARALEQAIACQRVPVFGAAGDEKVLPALVAAAAQQIASALAQVGAEAGALTTTDGASLREQILALRRSVQDDLVLMAAPPAGRGGKGLLRASVLAVAMPSGWDPQSKLGLDFLQIHAPVADAESLQAAAEPLSAALLTRSFCRHVWTLADTPALSAHPADRHPDRVQHWHELWFRCERQITVPLAGGIGVLFLIRVQVAPLPAVLAVAPERASVLVQALQTMSPAVLAYKGLKRWSRLVIDALA